MGLLSDVISGVLGGSAGSSPMGNILTNMLGGRRNDANPNSANTGAWNQGGGGGVGGGLGGLAASVGGLGGLISMFNQAGLGQVAQSWINSGPNQSVSPDQLRDVLGHQRVEDMSNQAGMDPGSFLNQLSQHLPSVVDGLTPNGKLPDEGKLSV